MNQDAIKLVMSSANDAYSNFFINIPLVLIGLLLSGIILYFIERKNRNSDLGIKDFLNYLVPLDQYTSSSAKIDIWVWFINGLLVIPVAQVAMAFVSLVFGATLSDLLVSGFGPGVKIANAIWAIVLIQFLGNYIGAGVAQYLGHLSFHKVPVLWALHRAHHSAESANVFAFLRTHPLEHVLNALARVVFAGIGTGVAIYLTGGKLLPATAAVIAWYQIIYVIIGFRSVDHTHIPVRYGKPLDILLGSPIMHQVHHSAETIHRDVNLAGAGYIFDWMFGTLYIPKPGETWRWGLNEDELGEKNPHQTVRDFFVEPLVEMWNVAFKRRQNSQA